MKDLEEAIKYAEEVAEKKDKEAYNWEYNYDMELPDTIAECKKCAADHRQLAEWLKDYKQLLGREPYEDAISRQAAIDAFERFIHELGIEDEPYNYGEMALSVKNVPPVTPQPKDKEKWIPVSKKLPEEIGTYLVTLDYKDHGTGITTLWFHGSLGWDLRAGDAVTAWMPLPQPYNKENEDKE